MSCGHRATSLATGNGSCVTQRGPYFGLGKPAIELQIIRSADSLICPTTQGGTYVRCTHVRLPWAMMFNAFSVSEVAPIGTGGQKTYAERAAANQLSTESSPNRAIWSSV